jgi:amino acid transporter
VFFAYIGFDALSTTAEECKNPQRDLPKAMFWSLGICTVLYVLITLVLTGLVPSSQLNVGDPLAFVFAQIGMPWFSIIISISAVVAMASVLLVFQLGQPRIWLNMSRDGLLWKRFSRIHSKFRTPSFATIVTGLVVAIPALFMNLTEVTDLTSIGTLFAFVLVCGGVMLLPPTSNKQVFRVPYVQAAPWILGGIGLCIFLVCTVFKSSTDQFFCNYDAKAFFAWETLKNKLPHMLFFAATLTLGAFSVVKRFSLIPSLGLLSCLYLMSELGYTNWLRFLIWLAIGLVVYFTYGIRNSKLSKKEIA